MRCALVVRVSLSPCLPVSLLRPSLPPSNLPSLSSSFFLSYKQSWSPSPSLFSISINRSFPRTIQHQVALGMLLPVVKRALRIVTGFQSYFFVMRSGEMAEQTIDQIYFEIVPTIASNPSFKIDWDPRWV